MSVVRISKGLSTAGLVLSLAIGVACQRGPDETRFLNFDAESVPGAYLQGWSSPEKTPDFGDSFTWAQARAARLAVFSRGDGDRLIRFRSWPFRYPGAPAQVVSVFVNDSKLDALTMSDLPKVYTVLAPKAVWKKGVNEIRFEFVYAEAPRDRIPGNVDGRTLSAAFDWVEIVPPLPQEAQKAP